MLKIRLRRMGSRHRPFYRVVVGDSRRTPRASALEEIGYYDPRKKPATLNIDVERADHWISHGAQPSETVERLIAQARMAPEAPAAEAPAVETDKAEAKAPAAENEAPAAEMEADAEAAEKEAPAAEKEAPAAEKEAPAAEAEPEADAETAEKS